MSDSDTPERTVIGGPDDGPADAPTDGPRALKFYFTPREALAGELKRLKEDNPHAKTTTYNPDVIEALQDAFSDRDGAIGEVVEYAGEQTVFVSRDALVSVCRFLKEEQGFTYLTQIGTIDRFREKRRFEVFYGFVNMEGGKRLRIKVRVEEDDAVLPSIVEVFRAATWHEREAWDMMGIRFEGHPDMRRMFMPEDFEHHPARKEFPTLGIPGTLPLPPLETDGELTLDPFPRAHGNLPKD